MKPSSLLFTKTEIKTQIAGKLKSVMEKLVEYSISVEAKTKTMSESEYDEIQSDNQFILKHGNRSVLVTHALMLLSFLSPSLGTPNHGLITAIFYDFKTRLPDDLIEEMYNQLNHLNQSVSSNFNIN